MQPANDGQARAGDLRRSGCRRRPDREPPSINNDASTLVGGAGGDGTEPCRSNPFLSGNRSIVEKKHDFFLSSRDEIKSCADDIRSTVSGIDCQNVKKREKARWR